MKQRTYYFTYLYGNLKDYDMIEFDNIEGVNLPIRKLEDMYKGRLLLDMPDKIYLHSLLPKYYIKYIIRLKCI